MWMQVKNIKDQATKSLQKGGEMGIPMSKTHALKTKNFINYYNREKTMQSPLKPKESLHNWSLSHRPFLAENFCNLRPKNAQQNSDFIGGEERLSLFNVHDQERKREAQDELGLTKEELGLWPRGTRPRDGECLDIWSQGPACRNVSSFLEMNPACSCKKTS